MSVAIIDYGSGNLHSARKAFERAAREAGVSQEIKVTARPEDVLAADLIVLPGVGLSPTAVAASTASPAWSRRWKRRRASVGGRSWAFASARS